MKTLDKVGMALYGLSSHTYDFRMTELYCTLDHSRAIPTHQDVPYHLLCVLRLFLLKERQGLRVDNKCDYIDDDHKREERDMAVRTKFRLYQSLSEELIWYDKVSYASKNRSDMGV